MREILLSVDSLSKHFPIRKGALIRRTAGAVRAVDGISFDIVKGETLGLVGESGCGKSTTARLILGLEKPTSGSILFEGRNILSISAREMTQVRRNMQVVFQDPFSSLNPRMTVREIIAEPMYVHGLARGAELDEKVEQLMDVVGLDRAYAFRYPHEFSGGQRQRIGLARALGLNPKLIICDEPVSALDVSVRAQVINLLQDLQEMFGLTYMFIAHDLAVVEHISDRVAVMYLGKIFELGEKDQLYESPMHPYTQALLAAVPVPDPRITRPRAFLRGDVPSPIDPPSGCRFHTRCSRATDVCASEEPCLVEYGDGHFCACHMTTSR